MREDWVECELGEISSIYNGNSINAKMKEEKYKEVTNGLNYIGTKDVQFDGNINYENGVKIPYKEHNFKIAPKGCVLVCSEGGSAGRKTAFVEQEICFGNKLYAITDKYKVINGKYIFYYTRYRKFFENFKNQMNGIIGGVSVRKFSQIPIPLPPLPEQRAIVAKIESLFSDLDNGIADLKKAQEQLKIYRQAVLKKAFEGELTGKWRALRQAQGPPLPTGEELLEQIKEEREKHYNQQVEEWQKAVNEWEKDGKQGKKPGKPKLLKEIDYLTKDEIEKLPLLNQYWTWCKIDKLSDFQENALKAGPFGSSLKKSFYTETGYKIYGQEQVISGDFKYGDYYVNEDKYNSLISCAVKPFDILISLVGSVGKVLILPENCEQGIINPRLVKISLNKFYNHYFFKYYFESLFLKSLYKVKNHGTTMDVLNLGILKELPYPLCSPEEQHQIVREIETRLSVCDKLEQSITEALEKADALRQSILKKAFQGNLLNEAELKLCREAPDYEPAGVLLARIQQSRNKVTGTEKGGNQ